MVSLVSGTQVGTECWSTAGTSNGFSYTMGMWQAVLEEGTYDSLCLEDIPIGRLGLMQQFSLGRGVAPLSAVDLEQQDGTRSYVAVQVQPSNGNALRWTVAPVVLLVISRSLYIRRFTTGASNSVCPRLNCA